MAQRTIPTAEQISAIPIARHGEYQLRPQEVDKTRRLLYGINKDGVRRFRTMLDGDLLMVWRIK